MPQRFKKGGFMINFERLIHNKFGNSPRPSYFLGSKDEVARCTLRGRKCDLHYNGWWVASKAV